MEKETPESIEMLKSSIETQLERMKGLTIDETTVETVKSRSDNFCSSIIKTLNEIEEEIAAGKRTAKEKDLKQCDMGIAQLRRINAQVNWEMMVIKAELSRAMDNNPEKGVLIKKHANSEDVLTIAPLPKKQCLTDTVPPNSPNISSDDELDHHNAVIYDFSGCFDNGTPNKPQFLFKQSTSGEN